MELTLDGMRDVVTDMKSANMELEMMIDDSIEVGEQQDFTDILNEQLRNTSLKNTSNLHTKMQSKAFVGRRIVLDSGSEESEPELIESAARHQPTNIGALCARLSQNQTPEVLNELNTKRLTCTRRLPRLPSSFSPELQVLTDKVNYPNLLKTQQEMATKRVESDNVYRELMRKLYLYQNRLLHNLPEQKLFKALDSPKRAIVR